MNKSIISIFFVMMYSAPLLVCAENTPTVESGPGVTSFSDQTHPQPKSNKSEADDNIGKTKKKRRKDVKRERIKEQKEQGTWPEPDKARSYGNQTDTSRSPGKNQDGSRNPGVTADSDRKQSGPNSERKVIGTTPKKKGTSEGRKTVQ